MFLNSCLYVVVFFSFFSFLFYFIDDNRQILSNAAHRFIFGCARTREQAQNKGFFLVKRHEFHKCIFIYKYIR